MIDQPSVHAVERRIELRKQQIREDWGRLRLRGRDALVSPAALGTFALLGGVIGWRSARRSSRSTERRNAAHANAARRSSPAGSVLRGVASGLLQTVAAIAVEEGLKGAIKGGTGETRSATEH
ncbi:MAG: hypothetical protein M3R31_01680 [Pseudomonadota bacterium]|nr:hypothetical protein [Pseudomonadota bacterium]